MTIRIEIPHSVGDHAPKDGTFEINIESAVEQVLARHDLLSFHEDLEVVVEWV